jgi:hypothetical protein
MTPLSVRLVEARGRLRLRSVKDGLFVQCPRGWRSSLPAGRALTISARLRSDGKCYVAEAQKETTV